jgi:hypothetical protein
MRAYADTETETETETALEPRALVRVAETYGVDVSDLHEACVVFDADRRDDVDRGRTHTENGRGRVDTRVRLFSLRVRRARSGGTLDDALFAASLRERCRA